MEIGSVMRCGRKRKRVIRNVWGELGKGLVKRLGVP